MSYNKRNCLETAQKLLKQNKALEAIEEYKTILKYEPDDQIALMNVGELFIRKGEPRNAIEYFERLAQQFLEMDGSSSVRAIGVYERIFSVAPEEPRLVKKLAELYFQRGLENWQYFRLKGTPQGLLNEDLANFSKALEIDPANAVVWKEKVRVLENLCQAQGALDCYDKAIEIQSRYLPPWYHKALALIQLCHFEGALTCFSKVLEIEPQNASAWHGKGRAFYSLDRSEEALTCYDRAMEIDPGNTILWSEKASVMNVLRRHDGAVACCEKALEIDPQNAFAWNAKGFALGEKGRSEEELSCYEKALEFDPKYSVARNNMAVVLQKLERFEEAIASLSQTLELAPDDAEAWRSKGSCQRSLGRLTESLASFDKALEIAPRHAMAWAGKGKTLLAQGFPNEALDCVTAALEIDPGIHEVLKLQSEILQILGRNNTRHQQPPEQPQSGLWKPRPDWAVEPCKDPQQVSRILNGDMFVLDSGREVFLEECYIERSALGWLCGRIDDIRVEVIAELPQRIQKRFPNSSGVLIKPVPDGDLPVYAFMVSLKSNETVGNDPDNTNSRMIVCWLSNYIDVNLAEFIAGEIRSVEWDKYAVNWQP